MVLNTALARSALLTVQKVETVLLMRSLMFVRTCSGDRRDLEAEELLIVVPLTSSHLANKSEEPNHLTCLHDSTDRAF